MKNKIKLFVWEGVLTDYTSGIAFALAETEEEARKMLIANQSYLEQDSDFEKEPKVYEDKMCVALWGGG